MGLFGPSKKEIWCEFAAETGGVFIDKQNGGVEYHIMGHQLYIDTVYTQAGNVPIISTRARIPIMLSQDIKLKIYEEGAFSNIGKILGMQDIETHDEVFNEKYIIKGDPEERVIAILNNANLRMLIAKIKKINLEIKHGEGIFGPAYPKKGGVIFFEVVKEVKEKELLHDILNVMQEMLYQMQTLNLVGENPPEVVLHK